MTDCVLLADDDDLFRQQLAERLSAKDLIIAASCNSANEVLQVLGTLPRLDAAVLDLKLGDDNGLDLIAHISKRFPECRVVMLTGYGSIPSAVDATRKGALDYLLKPVDMNKLVMLLKGAAAGDNAALPDTPPSLARLEWDYIQQVMADNDGNVSATARHLGIDRRTLQRKLQKRPSAQDFDRDRGAQTDSLSDD